MASMRSGSLKVRWDKFFGYNRGFDQLSANLGKIITKGARDTRTLYAIKSRLLDPICKGEITVSEKVMAKALELRDALQTRSSSLNAKSDIKLGDIGVSLEVHIKGEEQPRRVLFIPIEDLRASTIIEVNAFLDEGLKYGRKYDGQEDPECASGIAAYMSKVFGINVRYLGFLESRVGETSPDWPKEMGEEDLRLRKLPLNERFDECEKSGRVERIVEKNTAIEHVFTMNSREYTSAELSGLGQLQPYFNRLADKTRKQVVNSIYERILGRCHVHIPYSGVDGIVLEFV